MTTPGKIFLADQRGLTETAQFRRFSTLNFGSYQHEHKSALGALRAVNEEMLAGAQRVSFEVAEATHLLVLPITGGITFQGPQEIEADAEAGEILFLTLPAGSQINFANPYETEVISFLHLWLQAESPVIGPIVKAYKFTSEELENRLHRIIPVETAGFPFFLSLGRFAGRHEALYEPASKGSLVFAVVLDGAFEMEGRLLHQNDGLALWEAGAVDVEALSNDALLLVLEILA